MAVLGWSIEFTEFFQESIRDLLRVRFFSGWVFFFFKLRLEITPGYCILHYYWVSLFIDKNAAVSFDSSGISYIPQKLLSKITRINLLLTTYNEYSLMTLFCVEFFVLLSQNIRLHEKNYQMVLIYFHLTTIKRVISTLIQLNQYNRDKQNFEKKQGMLRIRYQTLVI